jgi:hypothetical protein
MNNKNNEQSNFSSNKIHFMKVIKRIGHPVVFICVYSLFITEGVNFGGFYMLYLLLALPHGALYAILAAVGIACIIIGFNLSRDNKMIKPILYLFGLISMILSLINFFATGDQTPTFRSTVPLTSFVLLCICGLFFFIYTLSLFQKPLLKQMQMV